MAEQLAQMLAVGGRSNSLGRVGEVVDLVLGDRPGSESSTDWIVAANAMTTLTHLTKDGAVPAPRTIALLRVQQEHRSKSVVRRADRFLSELTASRRE